MELPEGVFFMMPNIETLYICRAELSKGFLQPNPDGPHANRKLLPSLRSLILEDALMWNDEDWGHLTTYLAHQTSDDQIISLEMFGSSPNMPPEAVNGIEGLVKKFTYRLDTEAEDRGSP
jgi:hypothetical protein